MIFVCVVGQGGEGEGVLLISAVLINEFLIFPHTLESNHNLQCCFNGKMYLAFFVKLNFLMIIINLQHYSVLSFIDFPNMVKLNSLNKFSKMQ